MERKELAEKTVPKRTIPFFGEVNSLLYLNVRDELLKLAAEPSEPITLLFDSIGGNGIYARQLGDLIRASPAETIGIAIDAKSAAFIVLQYCTKRLIIPSGRLLVHSTRTSVENCRDDEFFEERLRNAHQVNKMHRKHLIDLIHSRSGLNEERIRELIKRGDDTDYHLYAKESLELKLVDAIIPADYKLFVPPAFPKTETPIEDKE